MKSTVFSLLAILGSTALYANTYTVDKAHSNVNFEVDHLMISTVEGSFKEFSGSFEIDSQKKALTKVQGQINAKSIDTNEADRDKHLRSEDFFHADKHPTLSFSSSEFVAPEGKKNAKMPGKLTIRGVPKDVVFEVTYRGTATDPWGNKKAAFDATTTIDRKEFGLKWNKALEAGGVLVGEKVQIDLHIEGNLVEEPKASEKEAKK